jgi:hypothetical protein
MLLLLLLPLMPLRMPLLLLGLPISQRSGRKASTSGP